MKSAGSIADFPKPGDWVLFTQYNKDSVGIIYRKLDRKTKISRKEVFRGNDEQVIATNIDIVFIVQAADQNFNLKRLDRYVAMVIANKILPVIVLNKIDTNKNWKSLQEQVEARFNGIKCIGTSASKDIGITQLRELIPEGVTATFVGSSGVGKSSLINAIIGEQKLLTKQISDKLNKGKHTTTHRELLLVPNGGAVIDTPGMRELFLYDAEEGLDEVFDDIIALTNQCRFRNCSHTTELGCAVLRALDNEQLDQDRYDQFIELTREQNSLSKKKGFRKKRTYPVR